MFKNKDLSLIYFTADPRAGKDMLKNGVDALLLDCETMGKAKRQKGFNTQINHNEPKQIKGLRSVNPDAHIMCRVNNANDLSTKQQIQEAINYGANTIVLPLIETCSQIKEINRIVNDKARLIIMIETQKGVSNFKKLSKEAFDGIYVGLNDLSISRGGRPLFEPLIDGTIEEIIANSNAPVGVGGATDPLEGYPIKSEMILYEYARLGVEFTVLRRSFETTIQSKPAGKVIQNIKQSYKKSASLYTKKNLLSDKMLRTEI